MNLEYRYWYFPGIISPEICDRIIEIGKNKVIQYGTTNDVNWDETGNYSKEDLDSILPKRNSHVSWLTEPWIYNIIKPHINQANKLANWNFQWDTTEQAQFTIYEPGQFYDWHPDQHHKTYGEDNAFCGKTRKISTTLLLNDPSEFEGGELEFQTTRTETEVCKGLDRKGSLVVFPSFVYHRVKPVTKGTRYSLVTWNLGWPFR